MLQGLSRITLDAIGLAGQCFLWTQYIPMIDLPYAVGFDHNIGALGSEQTDNELAKAFEDIFDVPKRIPALAVLQTVFPILECLVSMYRAMRVVSR